MSALDELPGHRTDYTKVQEAYISYFDFNKQSSSKHYMWMSLPIFLKKVCLY